MFLIFSGLAVVENSFCPEIAFPSTDFTESKTFSIKSAEVDIEGRVTNETKETIILSTNGESINDVLNTKKIILALSLESYDENSRIYFQTTDAIDIRLSAFIKVRASISLDEEVEDEGYN